MERVAVCRIPRARTAVRLLLKDGRVSSEERYLGELKSRIREVQQGADGALYLLTDSDHGAILRVSKKTMRDSAQ
jgi:aldose sugar dehydrogenase